MTNKKTLTPAEALRALADGKKLTFEGWGDGFIHLKNDAIQFDGEGIYDSLLSGFYEYTEPKAKAVWVEYLLVNNHPPNITVWHTEEPKPRGGVTYHPTGRKMEV